MVLSSTRDLLDRSAAWNDLWQRSDSAWPTMRAELLAQWIDTFSPHVAVRILAVEVNGALLAALPLVVATGPGSELRRPLGMTIIGGLLVSQFLTLYTTPVIYLLLDRLHRRLSGPHNARSLGAGIKLPPHTARG